MDATFKKQCQTLRRQGCTLNEICAKLGKGKSTVYWHIRDLPLSKERQSEIERANSERMRKYAHQHNGITRNTKGVSLAGRHPVLFTVWDTDLVGLVAHVLFDGSITHSSCVYYNRCDTLVRYVHERMYRIYPYPPTVKFEVGGVIRMSWHNVELAALVKAKADEILTRIATMGTEDQRMFLRALFDDEGCVTYSIARNSRLVRAYQHDLALLKLAQKLLWNFGIESRIDCKQMELIISRRLNLVCFRDEIGFSPAVCVNGKRNNSVWKQSLEKREILNRAIASYLPTGTPGVHLPHQ